MSIASKTAQRADGFPCPCSGSRDRVASCIRTPLLPEGREVVARQRACGHPSDWIDHDRAPSGVHSDLEGDAVSRYDAKGRDAQGRDAKAHDDNDARPDARNRAHDDGHNTVSSASPSGFTGGPHFERDHVRRPDCDSGRGDLFRELGKR